jgi:chaperonin GroEL
MSKIIVYKKEARDELKAGVKMLCDIVGSTLGAAGRGVIIDDLINDPFITADGVTVAQHVDTDATIPKIGIALVKNVANNTNFVAGDGTTTSIVLANSMLQLDKFAENKSPVLLKKGIERAITDIYKHLDKKTKKVSEYKDICNIATISARGDSDMGKLIADAYDHSGLKGQIIVEDGRKEYDSIEYITGYNLDAGWEHEAYCNNRKRMVSEYEEPLVYVTDFKLYEVSDVVAAMQQAADTKKPLVIIASEISEAVKKVVIQNIVLGNLSCTMIEAPEVGDRQSAILSDLAFYTGATYLSTEHTMSPKDFKPSHLGTCKKFISNKQSSVFLNDSIKKEDVEEYIKTLTAVTEDKHFEEKRIYRLHGRIAKILVWATTNVELREKRDRVEDAINATRAALEEGYVAGGGIALLDCHKKLKGKIPFKEGTDEYFGYKLIIEAITAPVKQMLHNLYDNKEKELSAYTQIYEKNYPIGFDLKNQKFVNMYKAGIIDPIKVTKTALKSSTSVLTTILNTNGVIGITGDAGKLQL